MSLRLVDASEQRMLVQTLALQLRQALQSSLQ